MLWRKLERSKREQSIKRLIAMRAEADRLLEEARAAQIPLSDLLTEPNEAIWPQSEAAETQEPEPGPEPQADAAAIEAYFQQFLVSNEPEAEYEER